jgi:L-rhamnose mutarotase
VTYRIAIGLTAIEAVSARMVTASMPTSSMSAMAAFLDEQRMECFVHERYRDSAAGLQHMANIEPMMKPMFEVCIITGEVCGAPEPELRRSLEEAGVTIYSPFLSTT